MTGLVTVAALVQLVGETSGGGSWNGVGDTRTSVARIIIVSDPSVTLVERNILVIFSALLIAATAYGDCGPAACSDEAGGVVRSSRICL